MAEEAWKELLAEDAELLKGRATGNLATVQVTRDKKLQAILSGRVRTKKKTGKEGKKSKTNTKKAFESKERKIEEGEDVIEKISEDDRVEDEKSSLPADVLSNADLTIRVLRRDINLISSENMGDRKAALKRVFSLLVPQGTVALDVDVAQEVLFHLQKPLLRRLSDTSEKCRELSIQILDAFLNKCEDIGPFLPYFFPALMDRSADSFVIDFETNEMVRDLELHEAKKRGVAVALPDAGAVYSHSVREPSEEIRLQLCQLLGTVVQAIVKRGLHSMLGPYFHDVVMFFHASAVDPFPQLKIAGLNWLQKLGAEERFANTMHHYCTALVRSVMPAMRHRQFRVRVAAIQAIQSLVACPFHAKQRGGGTEAIVDLVGFREDNVIPICAFYQGETRLNYFGFVVVDESVHVRLAFFRMISFWMTSLLDRWDHAPRLLPFLLSSLSDSSIDAQKIGLDTLDELGRQYEDENHDKVLEKRQYGVDGVGAIANYDAPLPAPWIKRPSLGTRLYVRQYSRRFLFTVLNELSDWRNTTKAHAVGLLLTILVYTEENITMELHKLVQTFVRLEPDEDIRESILACATVAGRFIDPEAYLKLLLPLLQGDKGTVVAVSESQWTTRKSALAVLKAMLTQSKQTCLLAHFVSLVSAISCKDLVRASQEKDDFKQLHREFLRFLVNLATNNGSRVAMDAHFVATGRLHSMKAQFEQLLCLALHLGDEDSFEKMEKIVSDTPVNIVEHALRQEGSANPILFGRMLVQFLTFSASYGCGLEDWQNEEQAMLFVETLSSFGQTSLGKEDAMLLSSVVALRERHPPTPRLDAALQACEEAVKERAGRGDDNKRDHQQN